ncbi:hypothetical protein B0H15DRAFT_781073 [Mycena belliarum]|uniref:Cyclin N-terminal domain-containing protein n=1 Tax=Mycena belliarum TaxID=1033014 RepID=A0AAD6U228_9AGAR|nr:hypothetical protein B0H15DRAFT_781073 [Mycena belliae]
MKSSLSSSSRLHPASLVDAAKHSPALLELAGLTISKSVVDYIVGCVSETVYHGMGRAPSPPARGRACSPYAQKFTTFVARILCLSRVTPPTLLTALVYVKRVRLHLSISHDLEYALERIFLGALIAASKYVNDSGPQNFHWACWAGVFSMQDIGLIERDFLTVLKWSLGVREVEVQSHYAALVSALGAEHYLSHARTHLAAPRRPARNLSVPELEPSSPASSAGSMSPRTPASPAPAPHPHSRPLHPKDIVNPAPHQPHPWNFLRVFHVPRVHLHPANPAIRAAA